MLMRYEHFIDTPFWAKLTFGNSSVTVGQTDTGGDYKEWEITDGYNGAQLAFRRRSDEDDLQTVWDELMMKAHHIVLDLHRQADEKFRRQRDWRLVMEKAEDQLEKLQHFVATGCDVGEPTADNLRMLTSAVDKLCTAHEIMDDIADPPE